MGMPPPRVRDRCSRSAPTRCRLCSSNRDESLARGRDSRGAVGRRGYPHGLGRSMRPACPRGGPGMVRPRVRRGGVGPGTSGVLLRDREARLRSPVPPAHRRAAHLSPGRLAARASPAPTLREQLRRARAKGVRARRVQTEELADQSGASPRGRPPGKRVAWRAATWSRWASSRPWNHFAIPRSIATASPSSGVASSPFCRPSRSDRGALG